MYAFIDESGNTGFNLFDPAQPHFFNAAMSSPTNFDDVFRMRVEQIARSTGTAHLHASEMGVDGVEAVASRLIDLVEFSQVRFYFAAVDKQAVVALKFFDAIFDPGENPAAPTHCYNIRALKFGLLFNFLSIVRGEEVRRFWNVMSNPRTPESAAEATAVLSDVLESIDAIFDPRAKLLIGDTLCWARDNVDEFSFWSHERERLYGNLPNVFTLPALFSGISDAAKQWGSRIGLIIHDRQSQFERTLREWHADFARLDGEQIFNFGDTPIRLADIHESKFEMRDSKSSPGLQLVDVVLWVFARSLSDKPVGPFASELLELCISPEDMYFMSLGNLAEELQNWLAFLMNRSLTEDQVMGAVDRLELLERTRQERMVAAR